MAAIFEFTPEETVKWNQWISEKPPMIRDMAERFPPNRLYRLKGTDQRVTLLSFNEDGTVSVNVGRRFNLVFDSTNVFGIDINDLEECDLPKVDCEVFRQKVQKFASSPAVVELLRRDMEKNQ